MYVEREKLNTASGLIFESLESQKKKRKKSLAGGEKKTNKQKIKFTT